MIEGSTSNTHQKSVTFITNKIRDNNRAQSLTSIMNELDDRGYSVNLITFEKRTPFDFAYHSSIKRYIIHDPYMSSRSIKDKVNGILSKIESSVFIFWGSIYPQAFPIISRFQNRGLKFILAQQDSQFLNLQKGSVILQSKINNILPDLFSVVSISEIDTLCNSMLKLKNAQTIPFLFPFKSKDFKAADISENDIGVIIPNIKGSVTKLLSILDSYNIFYHSNQSFTLHIVPEKINFNVAQQTIIKNYIKNNNYEFNFIIEEKIDKLKHLNFNPAFCVFLSLLENLPDIAIESVALRIPAIICKDYNYSADNGLNALQFAELSKPSELAEMMRKCVTPASRSEYQKDIEGCIEDTARNKTIEKWEKLINSDDVPESDELRAEATVVQILSDTYNSSVIKNKTVIANRSKPLFRLAAAFYRLKNNIKTSRKTIYRIIRSPYSVLRRIIKSVYKTEQLRTAKYQYINISDEQVKKLQLLAYKLLLEFDRICKKHDITYYIAAGTLLGGIRHKGFIPWDDDIDVTLPRPDYDKFLSVVKNEIGDEFSFRMDCSPYAFHRIELKGTRLTRSLQRKGHGVFVDLFPLDGAAPPQEQEKHGKINKRLTDIMWAKGRMIPAFKLNFKVIRVILIRLVLKIFVPRKLLRVLWDKNAKKYDCETAEKWVCLAGLYGYEKECFPKEFWGTPVPLEFEGRIFPTMAHWDDYLTCHYGDYMQLLPETQRRTHNMFSCDLGKYEKMTIEKIKEEVMGGVNNDICCGAGRRAGHENEFSNT
ncbi:MAG: LicD family protein [Clostridiales bacterium]|nr:LicD family protein [Clostridiales bacterium]